MSAQTSLLTLLLAQQRAAERDQRRVLLGEARDGAVVLHDVDDGLLEALPQARGLVRRPFVLLVDLARGDQHGELKQARTDGAVLAGRNAEAALARDVDGDVRRARARREVLALVEQAPRLVVEILRRHGRQARQRDGIDVGRQRRLALGLRDERRAASNSTNDRIRMKFTPPLATRRRLYTRSVYASPVAAVTITAVP